MVNRSIFSVLLLILMVNCDPVGKSLDHAKASETRVPAQESWNPRILINSDERETVQAQADYSAQYDDPREIVLIGKVQLDFFDETGGHASLMTADTGRIDDQTHLFTARGNVIVRSDSGMTLATNILFWNESKALIYTDQPITMTSPTDTLYGIGFESDANLDNWVITKPTGVTYRELNHE